MSHNGVIGRYSRYSVLPLFAVMESVLALRYRFYRAGRSWEGARKDRVHFPPYQGDFIRFSNIDIKIIVSFVSEMGNNLTKNGRQMRKHKGAHAVPISPTPVALSAPLALITTAPWTEELRYCIIQLFKDEVRKSKGADNGIKSQQWTVIHNSFKSEPGGAAFTVQQLQSYMSAMKRKWSSRMAACENCA
jgi:hypothetical protein